MSSQATDMGIKEWEDKRYDERLLMLFSDDGNRCQELGEQPEEEEKLVTFEEFLRRKGVTV